jgi:adenosylmethionine-8-amino-7-oxononanoate aminotransferase
MTHQPPGEARDASGGQGIELIAADGRRYIDASGGAAVSCLGHGHPAVVAAIARQAQAMAYAHTSFFTNPPDLVTLTKGLAGGYQPIGAVLCSDRIYDVCCGKRHFRHIKTALPGPKAQALIDRDRLVSTPSYPRDAAL